VGLELVHICLGSTGVDLSSSPFIELMTQVFYRILEELIGLLPVFLGLKFQEIKLALELLRRYKSLEIDLLQTEVLMLNLVDAFDHPVELFDMLVEAALEP